MTKGEFQIIQIFIIRTWTEKYITIKKKYSINSFVICVYVTEQKLWQKERLIKYVISNDDLSTFRETDELMLGCLRILKLQVLQKPANQDREWQCHWPSGSPALPQCRDTVWNSASQQGFTGQFLSWYARRSRNSWATSTGARGYLCWSDVKCIEKD